mgnify:CR=1 FL=1
MTPQRIMLVDNEEGLCRMMEAVLMDQGYQVKSFTRPVQAVAEFSAGDYDLIISDIKMPEMDGYTFTTEVRKDSRLSELHILLHTSLSGVFNRAMVEKVGANDFIAKFQPDVLAKTVLERLRHWRSARAA